MAKLGLLIGRLKGGMAGREGIAREKERERLGGAFGKGRVWVAQSTFSCLYLAKINF